MFQESALENSKTEVNLQLSQNNVSNEKKKKSQELINISEDTSKKLHTHQREAGDTSGTLEEDYSRRQENIEKFMENCERRPYTDGWPEHKWREVIFVNIFM